ncbi:MAG: hypothetical protein E7083_05670 [Bacteroidales bacterium]|nr:hypothetical protein [Bacteroidales bacterium]
MRIEIEINKNDVYEEVKKTSWYVGVKIGDNSYKIISINEEDRIMLDRFFEESKNTLINRLIRVFYKENVSEDNNVYTIHLILSDAFNKNLLQSIQSSLFSFYVMSIISKWFAITNKPESGEYATNAVALLEDVAKKVRYKIRPRH